MVTRLVSVETTNPRLPDVVVDATMPYVDVKAHLAVGDGSTNDTTAIQNAINEAQSRGPGWGVLFPPTYGNVGYLTSGPLTITSDGITLIGPGLGALGIKYTGTGTAVQFGAAGTGNYVYRCGVRGLRVTDAGGTGTVGFDLFVRESEFAGAMVHQGFATAGWRLNGTSSPAEGCWTNRFLHCVSQSGAGDGTQVLAQSNADVFAGCRWTSNAGDNLYIPITNGTRVTAGCQFENAGSGIEIHVGDRSGAFTSQALLFVEGSYFELKPSTAGARAVLVDGATTSRVEIHGNYVQGFGTANYAFEGGPSSGAVWGDAGGNEVNGVTVAHLRNSTALSRIGVVFEQRGTSGVFPSGATVPLVDNTNDPARGTGAGKGTSIEAGDNEILVTGPLRVTGLFTNTGTIKPRVTSIGSSATPTIDPSTTDAFVITSLTANITSITLNATPQPRQRLWLTITDNGTPRTLAFGASFESSGTVALPTTTVAGVQMEIEFVQNTVTNKFRCVRVS